MSAPSDLTLVGMSDNNQSDIQAARDGDLDAFGRLVLDHQAKVRAFLGARLRDHHQVDDPDLAAGLVVVLADRHALLMRLDQGRPLL